MRRISRRSVVTSVAAVPAAAFAASLAGQSPAEDKRGPLRQAGWCWDGQGFNGGVDPSIFGAGEGTRWFGLTKTAYMFHPNTELALEKLRDFEEVVCEISKWKVRRCENGVAHYLDGDVTTKCEEAAKVGRLSRSFRNVTGAIDDDLMGIIKRKDIKPDRYAQVYQTLKRENSALRLWAVVYDRELDENRWEGFEPFIDVVNLCVGDQTENFPKLGACLDQCRELFRGKPVNLIYRLRDFGHRPLGPVPMDNLKQHWPDILKYVEQGALSGYSILGGFLIDMHPEQARWLRDFIAAN